MPPSNCISRCLPFGSTPSSCLPFSLPIDDGRASTTTFPTSRPRSAAAVRQIVSPSGKGRPALRPEDHTLRRVAESSFVQLLLEPRSFDRGAVDRLDLQLVDPRGQTGKRLQVGRLDVADGQQRPPAAFQVKPQLSGIDDDVRPRGPRHP